MEASRRYLEHLREAWNTKIPESLSTQHQVLVTVPASFDAVARDLTLKAAEEAGYRNIILLEEPQAAFYAWIERNPGLARAGRRRRSDPGDRHRRRHHRFHADRRAGTARRDALERVAVGDHILLGGDNIDAALAHMSPQQIPQKLDAIQFHALWQQCRAAKEKLLADDARRRKRRSRFSGAAPAWWAGP